MLFLRILSTVTALATAVAASSVVPKRRTASATVADGTLELDAAAELFTFNYTTSSPCGTNWIGLYPASGGGPISEEYVSPATVWQYVPEAEGQVLLSTASLQPGDWRAFFLARDGYQWLAEPVNVYLASPPVELKFPVQAATLHNARQFEAYTASIGKLILGSGNESVRYEKLDGDRWITVSSTGQITGRPNIFASSHSHCTIAATAQNGSSAKLHLVIPIRRPWQHLVPDLRVMAFNLWFGGTRVNNFHEKQLRFILNSGADIIALQESTGGHATRLGEALGWFSYQSTGSTGIISRYPIVEEHGQMSVSSGVKVNLNGRRKVSLLAPSEVNVWSVHLGHDPYGPYDFCFDNMTKEEVLLREVESGRTPQITEILEGMATQVQESRRTPVILAGDFNAPSHLDWIPALQEKNCGIAEFDWPASILPTEKGFVDSFRVANPDVVADEGITWSPLFPRHNGDTGRPEPQDRIDYVYHTEHGLEVVGSDKIVVGNPRPSPNHRDNEWTTDHGAVLTHYRL